MSDAFQLAILKKPIKLSHQGKFKINKNTKPKDSMTHPL